MIRVRETTTAWFVGRLGPSFEHRSSRAMVGVSSIVAVAAGADGRTYVAGRALGGSTGPATVDFGSGIRLVVPHGTGASFVVAYAADGTALWVRPVESAYGGPGRVAVDATGRVIDALTYGRRPAPARTTRPTSGAEATSTSSRTHRTAPRSGGAATARSRTIT